MVGDGPAWQVTFKSKLLKSFPHLEVMNLAGPPVSVQAPVISTKMPLAVVGLNTIYYIDLFLYLLENKSCVYHLTITKYHRNAHI